jgi:hypothetical protein
MDGVDMSSSAEWRLEASILGSDNGTYGANWYLRHASDGVTFDNPPAGTDDWVVIDLNMGDIDGRAGVDHLGRERDDRVDAARRRAPGDGELEGRQLPRAELLHR